VRANRENERFRLPICLTPDSGADDKYTFLPRHSAAADRGNGQVRRRLRDRPLSLDVPTPADPQGRSSRCIAASRATTALPRLQRPTRLTPATEPAAMF
jgi:hypothetical protein